MKIIAILLILNSFLFSAPIQNDLSLFQNDTYANEYTNIENTDATSSKAKMKRMILISVFAFFSVMMAFMPLWHLIWNSVTTIMNAPVNEHYDRVVNGEPFKFFAMSMIVMILAYGVYDLVVMIGDNTIFKNYAPLKDLMYEYWNMTVPNSMSGTYASFTLSVMDGIVSSRMLVEMLAYFSLLLMLFASFFFVFSYWSNLKVTKSPLSFVLSSGGAMVVFVIVSSLFDTYASLILGSEDTALSIGRRFIQTGLEMHMDQWL